MERILSHIITGKRVEFCQLAADSNNARQIELMYQPEVCLTPDSITIEQAKYASRIVNQEGLSRVMELGVGSGVFLSYILLNSNNRNLQVKGIDIDENAIRISRYNLQQVADVTGIPHGSYSLELGDWLDLIAIEGLPKYDLLYCNPPYLPFGSPVRSESIDNPEHALFAGNDGLEHYHTIICVAKSLLKPQGYLFLRISNARERIQRVLDLVAQLMPQSNAIVLEFTTSYRRGKGIWIQYQPSDESCI